MAIKEQNHFSISKTMCTVEGVKKGEKNVDPKVYEITNVMQNLEINR